MLSLPSSCETERKRGVPVRILASSVARVKQKERVFWPQVLAYLPPLNNLEVRQGTRTFWHASENVVNNIHNL